jgi:hypothetical protein
VVTPEALATAFEEELLAKLVDGCTLSWGPSDLGYEYVVEHPESVEETGCEGWGFREVFTPERLKYLPEFGAGWTPRLRLRQIQELRPELILEEYIGESIR